MANANKLATASSKTPAPRIPAGAPVTKAARKPEPVAALPTSTPTVNSGSARPAARKGPLESSLAKAFAAPKTAAPSKAAKTPKVPGAANPLKAEKPEKAEKAEKAEKVERAEKAEKAKKPKLVRDSFTIPKAEYVVLDDLKDKAMQLQQSVKKSELLRAGIKALAAMSDAAFLDALSKVPAIKTGRPTKAD